jgi:hypothetical protein
VDFESTTAPVVHALRLLLPDLRLHPPGTTPLLVVWIGVLAALAFAGWRSAVPASSRRWASRPVLSDATEGERSWASPYA